VPFLEKETTQKKKFEKFSQKICLVLNESLFLQRKKIIVYSFSIFQFEIQISTFVLIIFIIFAAIFLLQTAYYSTLYRKIVAKKKPSENNDSVQFPVSVIICSHNDKEHLEKFLPKILSQNYLKFEIIVVNDCSTDETWEFLTLLKEKHKNLYVTTIEVDEQFSHGKKLALNIGIKAAKHQWLLFTDADCEIFSQNWIAQLQKNAEKNIHTVLGYVSYSKHNSLKNKFIRYDLFASVLQSVIFSLPRQSYVDNDKNLLIRKETFDENKRLSPQIFSQETGGMDLFIHKYSHRKNTKLEFNAESFVYAKTPSWKKWIRKKEIFFSSKRRYSWKTRILLSLEPCLRVLFLITFIILLFNVKFLIITALSIFLLREIFLFFVLYKITKRLEEQDLRVGFLLFDLIFPFFTLGIWCRKFFGQKQAKWK